MKKRVRKQRAETRDPQRGSALLLVSVLLIALMGGGGIALFVQISATKSVRLIKNSKSALFCAEAGLARAHREVAINSGDMNDVLAGTLGGNCPTWAPSLGADCVLVGDSDGDTTDDYEVRFIDDNDDLDQSTDSNLKFYIKSDCTKYPDTPRILYELIYLKGLGHAYRDQAGGGAGNTGNMN